jgi:hypothetical protein
MPAGRQPNASQDRELDERGKGAQPGWDGARRAQKYLTDLVTGDISLISYGGKPVCSEQSEECCEE